VKTFFLQSGGIILAAGFIYFVIGVIQSMTNQKQHTVEIAAEDGVTCSLRCTCGEELSGVNWEQAGHWFDAHQSESREKVA
jgi:hypothetical protein